MSQQVRVRFAVPSKGLYTSMVPDALTPEYSPWCQNVRFRFGQVQRAPGRSVTLATPFTEIEAFALHTNAAGTRTIFALGNDPLLRAKPYDPVNRTFGAATGPLPAASHDIYRWSWSQGEERTFVCKSSVPSAINVPSPNTLSVEVLSAPQARLVEYFNNRVILANLVTVSNRIQWSGRAAYNDWLTTEGHGGFLDLYDGENEPITGLKVLNDRLVVYRRTSITDLVSTGDPTVPFLPEGRAYGIGCIAPWSLVNLGQFHIFLGNDFNVYLWDGAKLNAIGTPVHAYIRRQYDPYTQFSWRYVPYGAAFMSFKEYWLVMRGPNGTVVLVYDYLRDSWTRDVVKTGTFALLEQTLYGAEGTAGYDYTGFARQYPVMLAGTNGDFYMFDERVDGDRQGRPSDGAMEMFFETPDLYYDPETAMINGTMQRAMVTQGYPASAADIPFKLELSIDRGRSWIDSLSVVPQDVHWGYEFADFNQTSNVYRWRMRHVTDSGTVGAAKPSWRSYTSVFVPSGEFFPIERAAAPADPTRPPLVSATGVEGEHVGDSVAENEPVPPSV